MLILGLTYDNLKIVLKTVLNAKIDYEYRPIRVVKLVLNLSLFNTLCFSFYRKRTLYICLSIEREIKCVKQGKIQYQFHDTKQAGI